MNETEAAELHAEADKVAERDHHLGAVLHTLITHLAHAHRMLASAQPQPAPVGSEETPPAPRKKEK